VLLGGGAVVVLAAVAVGVVLLLDRGEEPAQSVAPSSPTPAAAVTLEPVSDLEASASSFEVELTWNAPDGDLAADGYEVFRDGDLLEEVPGSASAFTDDTVLPEQSYEYAVRAHAGGIVADDVTVDVTTPTAPLNVARVAGNYSVKARLVSKSGVDDYPSDHTRGWRLKPRCKQGPCSIVWSDLYKRSERIRLERQGKAYEGSGTSSAFIECQGVESTSSVEVRLVVDRARVVRGSWTATRLSGTLTHSESEQLGCRAGRVELAIRAVRVR
jgi:hypothetical protein